MKGIRTKKYQKLFDFIEKNNNEEIKLTYKDISNITGYDLPRSYLKDKNYIKRSSIGEYLKKNNFDIEVYELVYVFKRK